MPTQQYTIANTGTTLGDDAVEATQNQVDPQRETAVLSFTCPENFDRINYVGNRDAVRFVPRTKETFDGDGDKTEFDLSAGLLPVTGETELEDQPYPIVVASVGGDEVEVADVDYAGGTVTLASAPAAGTGNVAVFPIITDGTVKFRGVNTLGQVQGPLYPWPHPIYRWADFDQDKRGTEINLPWPSFEWERNETLDVMLDSEQQIVWEDSDYPEAYVSTFELDVEITF